KKPDRLSAGMSFSKQILVIFGSVACLLAIFAFLVLKTLKQIDARNDELIDDKMHIFSQVLIAVNDAKSLEAAGAHFLIVNTQKTYDLFQQAHLRVRGTIQNLLMDPHFESYKGELNRLAELELKALNAGASAFKA